MRKFFLTFFFQKFRFGVLELKRFNLQFLVDILPLGSGSVDLHIFADPDQDPGSQNLGSLNNEKDIYPRTHQSWQVIYGR